LIEKAFLTSLAASLHVAGLQDEQLSFASQPSLEEWESDWVEGIVKCASALDSYWRSSPENQFTLLDSEFKAPAQFEDLKQIGHGGMGVVYSAFDKTTNETVALKVGKPLGGSADAIKREFRTLAKIRHPNLVVLKELHQFNDSLFFSMEIICGDQFNSPSVTQKNESQPWRPRPFAELCDRLLQLVDGIDFLHQMNFVHCDLKPSNILVTQTGRVVVLDLGLARSTCRQQAQCFGGTSAYMPPEQAAGEPPKPASDWFAFGVVMFETLFGYRPFQGSCVDVLFDKLAGNAVAPTRLADTGIAESISNLCIDLLNPRPDERPTVQEIRQCLESASSQSSVSSRALTPRAVFFGRETELAILQRALIDSRNAATPTLLLVEGESGIGKTRLVQEFLDDAHASAETVVLSGRCYENERIPYKAIDAVIGELAAQWRLHHRPESVDQQLINSIGAAFKGFSSPGSESNTGFDESQVPVTAADGLQSILTACAGPDKQIIIFIDDIQWADADSGDLLRKMIHKIPLLLICSHRPMESANLFLNNLLKDYQDLHNQIPRRLKISPFSDQDAAQFLERNFPRLDSNVLDKSVQASKGIPIFLTSLASQLCAMPAAKLKAKSLDWTRHLDAQSRRLLEFICASGYPLPQSIALQAAGISEDSEASISSLSSSQLITLCQSNGETMLTPFHDMIRETTYSHLNALERKTVHCSLATVSEGRQGVPPDRLAFHFREAGDRQKSCHYSILSGDVAASSRAFDEAVRAYEDALAYFVGTNEARQDLKQKLASSLGRLGRSSDAGDLYLELAASGDRDGQLMQLAACQYCFSGQLEDAYEGFNRFLKPWGYSIAKSDATVLWRFLRVSLRLKISAWLERRAPFFKRHAKAVLPNKLQVEQDFRAEVDDDSESEFGNKRLSDLLWDTANALTAFDMLQSFLFVKHSLRVAIRENDEARILRGKISCACRAGWSGTRSANFVKETLVATDTPTTKRIPFLTGLHLFASGSSAYGQGKWKRAFEVLTKADEHLSNNCIEAHREIGAAQLLAACCLNFMGEVKAAKARYRNLLSLSSNCEHVLNTSNLMNYVGSHVCLFDDNPAEALLLIDKAIELWPIEKPCFQHVTASHARASAHLYAGRNQIAFETVEKLWKKFRRSNFRVVEFMRVFILDLRGRCAIGLLETADGPNAKRIASLAISLLEREKICFARPMAQRVLANLELKKQNREAAEIALTAARDGFEQCDMEMDRYTAEAKLCEIIGQLDTKRFQKVEDWFSVQGVKNPKACIEVHYPATLRS
jgi:serine/threonine protein kinase